jgi:hypothetical protein
MQLEYEVIEDSFDDTTNIRTMTEQALVKGKGWLIRTTIYSPHHISSSVAFLSDKAATAQLFKPLAP